MKPDDDRDDTGRTTRLAIIEDYLEKQHSKVGTISMQMVELVGISGAAGTIGQMKQDFKELEDVVEAQGHQIDRLDQVYWKILALASAGAVVGGAAFGLVKWLLERGG
jgi:hypothetical protein